MQQSVDTISGKQLFIKMEKLLEQGYTIGRNQVRRLRQQQGLMAIQPIQR